MDAIARDHRTTPARRQTAILHVDRIAHSRDAPAGPRARGYAPRDRGAVEFRKRA
jgi:hypothetical protein